MPPKEILQTQPHEYCVLSQFDQDALIKETYRIGARAFVTKVAIPEFSDCRAKASELKSVISLSAESFSLL